MLNRCLICFLSSALLVLSSSLISACSQVNNTENEGANAGGRNGETIGENNSETLISEENDPASILQACRIIAIENVVENVPTPDETFVQDPLPRDTEDEALGEDPLTMDTEIGTTDDIIFDPDILAPKNEADIVRVDVKLDCGGDFVDVTATQFRRRLNINPKKYRYRLEDFVLLVNCFMVPDENTRVLCQTTEQSESDAFQRLKSKPTS